jgi:D-alanyl-D-alanine carboxypeptidase
MIVIGTLLRTRGLRARGGVASILACGAAVAVLLGAASARAQIGSERYASIVVDVRSGASLVAASPDEQRYPASLTKMMTAYMAFDAIRERRTTMNSPIYVSEDAASMPPSKLGLYAGSTLTVEEAILAMVTKSANDAAAALGEHLGGGSEARFAQMMTMKARQLGMRSTSFRNASGLPNLDQVTTARDMAILGRRLMTDYPQYFHYFSTQAFAFNGRTHTNHNRLLRQYDGADGIKTGYINDSGFNLVASARRDGVRLVAAVFGGSSSRERDQHMMALLDQGFSTMGVAPREPMIASEQREFTPYAAWQSRISESRADRLAALREARAERIREAREAKAERARDTREARAERAAPVLRGHVFAANAAPANGRAMALPPPVPARGGTLFAAQAAPVRGMSNVFSPMPLPPPRAALAPTPTRGAPMQLALATPVLKPGKAEPIRLAALPKPPRMEQGDTNRDREPRARPVAAAAKLPTPAPAPAKPGKK